MLPDNLAGFRIPDSYRIPNIRPDTGANRISGTSLNETEDDSFTVKLNNHNQQYCQHTSMTEMAGCRRVFGAVFIFSRSCISTKTSISIYLMSTPVSSPSSCFNSPKSINITKLLKATQITRYSKVKHFSQ